MLGWAITFLIIAVIAAVFGFGGIAAASAEIAKVLFFLFLVICIIFFLLGWRAREPPDGGWLRANSGSCEKSARAPVPDSVVMRNFLSCLRMIEKLNDNQEKINFHGSLAAPPLPVRCLALGRLSRAGIHRT